MSLIEMFLNRIKSYCLKVPSDKGSNLLVQSNCNQGTFTLIAIVLNFQMNFIKNGEKINKKK